MSALSDAALCYAKRSSHVFPERGQINEIHKKGVHPEIQKAPGAMKNALPDAGAERDDHGSVPRHESPHASPTHVRHADGNACDTRFRVVNLRPAEDAGSVRARFDVEFYDVGVAIRQMRLHRRRGGFSVETPGRIAMWLPSRWEEHATFDPELLDEILEVVLARLDADREGVA